jgi:hypothetical protein
MNLKNQSEQLKQNTQARAASARSVAIEEALAEAVSYLDSGKKASIPSGSIMHHIMRLALASKHLDGKSEGASHG